MTRVLSKTDAATCADGVARVAAGAAARRRRVESAGAEARAKSVVVVGAGGNIGSHLVAHLARMGEIGRVTLIDFDAYEPANLRSQEARPRDVGRKKVSVQARRLRAINPALEVRAIGSAVESVPLGLLRADVILACLDSRRARQHVNQAAWRLGVTWIDSGVEAAGLLARVNVYAPAPGNPCLECAWDERHYAALEQTYPCAASADADAPATPPDAARAPADAVLLAAPPGTPSYVAAPTAAPSYLGALAAALLAAECAKLLRGDAERAAVSRQVTYDAAHHRLHVAALRRQASCRMPDHTPWQIAKLDARPEELTVADALRLGPRDEADAGRAVAGRTVDVQTEVDRTEVDQSKADPSKADRSDREQLGADVSLLVEGRRFVRRLVCVRCGVGRGVLRLAGSLGGRAGACRRCGAAMRAAGVDVSERLEGHALAPRELRRTLRSLGLRPGDVFTVARVGRAARYELAE
jgi:molybdopterin/thiamine biosynthesis adenylyltransferase